jgi:hypothetical protein
LAQTPPAQYSPLAQSPFVEQVVWHVLFALLHE